MYSCIYNCTEWICIRIRCNLDILHFSCKLFRCKFPIWALKLYSLLFDGLVRDWLCCPHGRTNEYRLNIDAIALSLHEKAVGIHTLSYLNYPNFMLWIICAAKDRCRPHANSFLFFLFLQKSCWVNFVSNFYLFSFSLFFYCLIFRLFLFFALPIEYFILYLFKLNEIKWTLLEKALTEADRQRCVLFCMFVLLMTWS